MKRPGGCIFGEPKGIRGCTFGEPKGIRGCRQNDRGGARQAGLAGRRASHEHIRGGLRRRAIRDLSGHHHKSYTTFTDSQAAMSRVQDGRPGQDRTPPSGLSTRSEHLSTVATVWWFAGSQGTGTVRVTS